MQGLQSFFEGFSGFFIFLKIVFIVFDVGLVVILVFSISGLLKFRPNFVFNPAKHKRKRTLRSAVIAERWSEITKRLEGGSLDAVKFAIIDADGLVDDILKQLGLPGEHFADRLARLTSDELKSFPRIWRAHRVRNDLVHSPGFAVSQDDAKETIGDYEAFLKEIEAI
ncbi:MAG: hypothetical protein AAB495_03065 [Patescibacteria group bacterium]